MSEEEKKAIEKLKDKIKAKIEENQEKLNNTNGFIFQQEYRMKIKILNELFEEINKWVMI